MKDKGQGKKSKSPKDSHEKTLETAMNILIVKNEEKNEKVGPSLYV